MTYTSALARDSRLAAHTVRRLDREDLLLLSTSLVAMLAIGLAYAGRSRTVESFDRAHASARVTNLNTVETAGQLEFALEPAFENTSDRRFAARELFQFLVGRKSSASDRLPNVGAILQASVPVTAIERTPGLVVYTERLRVARESAARAGRSPPESLPLFSARDLAALKPLFVVRTPEAFARLTLLYGAFYIGAFYLVALLWRLRAVHGDRGLLAAAHLLTAVGFAALLSRPDPLRDTLLFVRYTEGILIGLAFMGALSLVDFRKAAFLELSYLPLIGALSLSVLLIVFGDGPGTSGAKVNLGPVQPIEAIRLLLALFLAGYFARRWELLRQIQGAAIRRYRIPPWLNLPRADYVLPVLVSVGAALGFFFLQKDLGPALFLACVFLALYAVARGRFPMAIAGMALLAAGFYAGYRLNVSETLVERVRMWQSPWDNAVGGGDQVAQAVWALATGGLFGTGLGLGDTQYLPAGHTDLVLAAIGEELGLAGLLAVAAVYVALARRGFRIALTASGDYGFFLATAITLFVVIPVLLMSAGVLGITPLTGVVTPFLSYGGSAMTANFAALGILTAIHAKSSVRLEPEAASGPGSSATTAPFRAPMRYLCGALAVATVSMVVALSNVQVVRANDYAVKPHLTLQADGVRRYQYNQRVLDLIREIPRGNVYDRNGLPLATTEPAIALRSRDMYGKLAVSPNATCLDPVERCYPLGGIGFHLLGDSPTRLNWSATNTSYLERDAEDTLRGFDDHTAIVQSIDASGRPVSMVRRDYRELVPLLRHRYNPSHSAVTTLLARQRDLTLTVDARLQVRVSTLLAEYGARSRGGKAAAVVLDPDTGDLLASASYPWPMLERYGAGEISEDRDALLDRARYGLFPPGSTFKLVTAAAALRRDISLRRATFMCTRLPNGRVGTLIPGGRTVRDDILERRPHGAIDMHDGIVHSCNAYFAQLAQRIGPEVLVDTAARLGISLGPPDSDRLRDTLPQAGYGQGDVVATPLRMARVAAVLASGGVLHETRLENSTSVPAKSDAFLSPQAAQLLARDMRDAVVHGTGRGLRNHPWRIAGKTGTAEVAGSASHAWFIGFAPYGPAAKRIAFAVIIEHAGYGGNAAAPLAAEIVTAARAAGLIQ